MIGYVTLGTNDLEAGTAFYDDLFALLDAKRMEPNERIRLWRTKGGSGMLGISKPFDEQPAGVGNGTMVAVNVGSTELVDRMHEKALALGGTDEGPPGPRGEGGFYGGYFRDLDGNKLVVFCLGGK